DVRAALEGKLKPREEVIHLGRAMVRETFKISRVGTIAGCYVTQGTIERSAKVRVIREGVVIYPPPDKTAGLESLKRFKEDKRQVVQGIKDRLRERFNVSVAEVEAQDNRQLAVLGVAMVGAEAGQVRGALQQIAEHLRRHPVAEFIDCEMEV